MVNLQYTFCTKGETECPPPTWGSTSACKHGLSEPFERAHSSTGMCPPDTAPRPAACLTLHLTAMARTGVANDRAAGLQKVPARPLDVASDSGDDGGVRPLHSTALMETLARRTTRLAELELDDLLAAEFLSVF